jgi:hypothetical protein
MIYKPVILRTQEINKNRLFFSFFVRIDSKRLPKGMTIETLKESEEKTGYDMQNAAYTWLLHRRANKAQPLQDR